MGGSQSDTRKVVMEQEADGSITVSFPHITFIIAQQLQFLGFAEDLFLVCKHCPSVETTMLIK